MNQERLLKVLVAPVISEKATAVADALEQIVFKVTPDATKEEIKSAIELLFKREVISVRVLNVKGKAKRFGRYVGQRKLVRKAYVSLKPGQDINFAEVQ